MKITKFSICSISAGIGYFAGVKANKNPATMAIIGSQVIGRGIDYLRTGNTDQLSGMAYASGTVVTLMLGEILKYSGLLSPELSFLLVGISAAVVDCLIENNSNNDNRLPMHRLSL